MRKYGDAGDSPAGTGVSRRAMLVGSGGLMIATAVGWTSGGLVSERLDQAPGLLRQVGETVRAGDPIARVGASGSDAESGLYFELRRDGKPFDPLRWVTP